MSQHNKITFLVNNDYPLPDGYKVVRNTQGFPEHEFFNLHLTELYNPLLSSNLIAFIGENTRIEHQDLEEIITGLFEYYPEIEFIFTDVIIDSNGYQFVDYFSGDEIPDVSFFVNLRSSFKFEDVPQSKIQVMNHLVNQDKMFLHIPDPLIITYHSL